MEKAGEMILQVKSEIGKSFSFLGEEIISPKEADYLSLGKAVRSRFSFYIGKALDIPVEKSLTLAVCAEIVHNASLLHDDCIDEAVLRRGRPTANSALGINKAILIGDLAMAAAFKKAENLSCEISSQLVAAVGKMAESALLEENFKNKLINRTDYYRVVSGKTSALFRWMAVSSAFFVKEPFFEKTAAAAENFGLAFQITDDAIDIENCGESGKDCLKDLSEGKCSMPLIIALENENFRRENETMIRDFFSSPVKDLAAAADIAAKIREGGFCAKARKEAEKKVLDIKDLICDFPNREGINEFYGLAMSICSRSF